MSFNVTEFRSLFPQLKRQVDGHSLVYFDSAATSLKPKVVADALYNYYTNEVANIHRGAHYLSRQGTEKYEQVREKISSWIGAGRKEEIIFTRGVTESINLLSYTYGFEHIGLGDVILLSPFEHHSNIIPWKILSENTGCQIEVLPFDQNGQLDPQILQKMFTKKVRLVSLMLYSNVTGVRLNVEPVLKMAREKEAITVIDAAQAMLHESIDVQKLDCDFLTFSAHKMFGPFGVGILYGRYELLQQLPPFQGGGSMISSVTWDKTVYQDAPFKFEAGTPSIADVIATGVAVDFIRSSSLAEWTAHGRSLGEKIEEYLLTLKKAKLLSPRYSQAKKTDIVSFVYEGAHSSDVGEILDQMGIAVRAGHMCAQPLMDKLGVPGTVRVSLAPYNNHDDVERFMAAMSKVGELL